MFCQSFGYFRLNLVLKSTVARKFSLAQITCPYHSKRSSGNFSTFSATPCWTLMSPFRIRSWSSAASFFSLPRGAVHSVLQSASTQNNRRRQGDKFLLCDVRCIERTPFFFVAQTNSRRPMFVLVAAVDLRLPTRALAT